MKSVVLPLLAVLALVGFASPAAVAAERAPLLMEGKKTLYQRVLTRPGATLAPLPGKLGGKAAPALSLYYVYDRREAGGPSWLEVGTASDGKAQGWIREDYTLPWKQQMTLAFTNPAGRERTLLFKDRQALMDLAMASDPGKALDPIRKIVQSGKTDPRVVSIEPETHIDFGKQFYLLPVLDAEETFTGDGHRVRLLRVASVTAKGEAASPVKAEPSGLRDFTAGIVFVIDSTISMGPYIERTREAVRRIHGQIEKAGLADKVRFGLVAFRSSTEAVQGLDYTARLFADPNKTAGAQDFLKNVESVAPASVSSPRFDEDAYAGVMEGLGGIDWKDFGGRYLVLITDAGPLRGADPLSATRLDAEQVRLEAQHRGVALYTLHLKTPQGRDNHRSAEAQYRVLSTHPLVSRPLYYPVEAGAVDDFGRMVDTLSGAIVAQVGAALRGEEVAGAARTATTTSDQQIRQDVAAVGHAMRLAYLGRESGTSAPPLISAWLADRDLAQPDRATTEVRVLLTKNQLSDMAQVLSRIFEAGQAAQLAPQDFFSRMQSIAAVMGRDPNGVQSSAAVKLADLGLMGEYLDGLPYRSKILSVDQALWSSWSIVQQQQFLDEIQRKLRLYRIYHDDVDRWVSLAEGADAGAAVYPVPLDALP